ncbi:hypothetical protein SERLADRAFT_369608 [Serpula lacrymans var. lacrymans S7.9]|uniref:Uncharacterized protein n=1 Tax=Serpula lacrymans var. lacrymans (strain S7.9) TaxID=578457 RepID=F8NWG5_SERL9|nr:uncharacterized protein SERLADRAFT_369608 [Serpula lacrymans var. lacrymans S7.9]EGO24369.1 hypothetical protein SERLADRAFT_369608 [Serpula lacrymans var. lacrymans S7.9]
MASNKVNLRSLHWAATAKASAVAQKIPTKQLAALRNYSRMGFGSLHSLCSSLFIVY